MHTTQAGQSTVSRLTSIACSADICVNADLELAFIFIGWFAEACCQDPQKTCCSYSGNFHKMRLNKMHGNVMMPTAVSKEGLNGVSIAKLPNLTVAAPALI